MTGAKRSLITPQPRPGRSPVNEKKYAEIVEVAGGLFASKGFDGTSLTDIAVEVGVLKGSLYHYITSKEQLLAEVVRIGQLGQSENLVMCERFAGRPLEQLVAFAYGHIRLNATPERLERGIVFLRDGEKLSPPQRQGFVEKRDEYEHYLRTVVVQGQEQGLIDPQAHPRLCVFAILGVINSFSRWYDPHGPSTPNEIGREFAGFALAAVRKHLSPEARQRFSLVDDVVQQWESDLRQSDLHRTTAVLDGLT